MNITEYIESPLPIQRELDFFFNKQDALIIFDIGACEGEDSVRYKKLFKNAHVYSFEPLPKNQIKIRETLAYHGLQNAIEVFSIALSDTNGTAIFHVSSGT